MDMDHDRENVCEALVAVIIQLKPAKKHSF